MRIYISLPIRGKNVMNQTGIAILAENDRRHPTTRPVD